MSYPPIDLNSPTHLVLHWGWVLMTSATFVVLCLLVLVFVLGATVREPGVRRDLERIRRERLAATEDQP